MFCALVNHFVHHPLHNKGLSSLTSKLSLVVFLCFCLFVLILHFGPIILFIKCWCCFGDFIVIFGRFLGNGKCAPQSRPQFHNVVDFASASIDLGDLYYCGYVITLACVGCIVIKF
jgi:hypothetical protein